MTGLHGPGTNRRAVSAGLFRERGSATVELILFTPVLLMLLYFVIYCGRLADARLRLEDAAHQSARAASLARTPGQAAAEATDAAAAALAEAGVHCRSYQVAADTGRFRPGGQVGIALTCTVPLDDLALLRLPGSDSLTARATAPLDEFRGEGG